MKTNARKPAQNAGSFVRSWRVAAALTGLLVCLPAFAHPLAGQVTVPASVAGDAVSQPAHLPALIARARAANPEIRAMDESVAAARARATAAGALPDPMLGVGLVNALVSDPLSSEDFMTMRVVEVGQRLPYPGKLDLEREAARWDVAAVEAERERVELEVVASIEGLYYELFFLNRSLTIAGDNRALLEDFVSVTEARYGVGTGSQQDVLKAQVEVNRLGDELLALENRRTAALARLNALLDRPSAASIGEPAIPERIVEAAVRVPGTQVRFTSAALESDSDVGPIPSLATLQRRAERQSPMLAAHLARIEAQRAAAEVAGKAALPDFDVSAGYGQRSGREDMITVMVSVPIPIFKGGKQDRLAVAERAELASLEAGHRAMINDIHAEVAELHASLVRTRDHLALLREGILPQARASLESAVAAYPVATVDFLTLLDNQATLFRHEIDYYRLLTDFAQDLAKLEQIIGGEVLQ